MPGIGWVNAISPYEVGFIHEPPIGKWVHEVTT